VLDKEEIEEIKNVESSALLFASVNVARWKHINAESAS
jgi:hypothetical protein